MKRAVLLIAVWFALAPCAGRAADDYGYPFQGEYDSTILGTPDALKAEPPKKIDIKELVVTVVPGLSKPDVFFYDEGLRALCAFQDRMAPMIFLIPGAGANHRDSKVVAMMQQFYKAGYHVVTLPSPTHPNFIISASRSHIPGEPTEDALDLYGAMEVIWNRVKGDITVSDFSLGGYSLGATHAAFLAKLDEERKIFSFRKVLMINPAVNLYNSVNRLEELLDRIPGGPRRIVAFFNRLLAKFIEFYRRGIFVEVNNQFFFAIYKAELYSNNEAGGIIGLSYRLTSAGMIFASDVMANGGYVVPKNRVLTSTDSLTDYFVVSVHLSFLNYFDEYFYPYFHDKHPDLTREEFINSLGLRSIEEYLKGSPKFAVMGNENDFILTSDELDYLRRLFGERIKIYPRGGHCGNMEYKENVAHMIRAMEPSQ